jgi:hypothetical protein
MLEERSSSGDLVITAYHEVGHAVVARFLGIPNNWIVLKYKKQPAKWEGEHNGYYDFDPSFFPDRMWDNLHLDSKIPYDELRFEYPTYPEPYQEYKKVRDRCTIDYAGLVTQRLFYKRRRQEESPIVSEGCSDDMKRAKERLGGRFQAKDIKKELAYAENHAEKILSNEIVWRMLEDLAEYMVNAVLTNQKEAEEYDLTTEYWFARKDIYQCFERTLTGDNS